MLFHKSCDLAAPDSINRKSHGKKSICVFSKCFSVSEIPPSTNQLSKKKSIHDSICHHKKVLFLDPGVNEGRKEARDNASVNGKSAISNIQNTYGIILVIIPGEEHIVNPRSYYGKDNDINRYIPVIIRILASLFGHMGN